MKLGKASFLFLLGFFFAVGCTPSQENALKASIYSNLGMTYLQQGDPTSALRELLEAERLNPKDPHIQFALGWAYSAKGRFPLALEHYQKTLVLDPKYTEAHNAMGATYLEVGKWDEALHEFELVLKDLLYLTPFYVQNNIGWAYYKKGESAKAIESFKRAISMKPDFGLAYYNLGLVYKDGKQPAEAIPAFRLAAEKAPNFLEAHFQLGLLYFNAQKYGEAKKSFQEVIRLAPQSENAKLSQRYLDLLK